MRYLMLVVALFAPAIAFADVELPSYTRPNMPIVDCVTGEKIQGFTESTLTENAYKKVLDAYLTVGISKGQLCLERPTVVFEIPASLQEQLAAGAPEPEPAPVPKPEPDPEPIPDPNAGGPPAAESGDHPYYDSLLADEHFHAAAHLRSQPNVLAHVHFSKKHLASTAYDSEHDAAKFRHPTGKSSITTGDQVRFKFPQIDDGTFLVYWEAKMDASFSEEGGVGGMATQKAFQIGRSTNDSRAIEPRHRYVQADPPFKARVDVRTYIGGFEGGPQDSIRQHGDFFTMPEVWTYYWFFLDIDTGRADYWVGDANRKAVKIIDNAPWIAPRGKWNQFWFEFDSSQVRNRLEAYAWGRNAVVLKDLTIAEAQALVESR